MKIITADFESFWSVEHSLTKMNPIVYALHPDTEIISLALKVNDEPTQVVFGESAAKSLLSSIDWSDAILVAHNNSGFDAMLFSWRFGIKPKLWACTLAMARPHHASTVGGSLAKLVAHYNLGVKDQSALMNTKGKHLKDFTDDERAAMAEYNKADTDQCYGLFKILIKKTPVYEMKLIDQSIRQLIHPAFECDTNLLENTLAEERFRKKENLLNLARQLGANVTDPDAAAEAISKMLGSSAKFAEFLRSKGVEPPMKVSPTTGKETYALAKTDQEFLDLQEHDDPIIAAASAARLGVKSTMLETRIETFLEVAEYTDGSMPVAVNYYAAHTGRNGGSMKLNQLNLPRIPRDKDGNIVAKPSNALRCCHIAPRGHKVVVADLSGIELRVNMFLWKVPYAMELFTTDPEKADLYKVFAGNLYNVPPTEVSKQQRQIGKIAHLGLGYGAGAATFQKVAKMMGGVELDISEAKSVVDAYRVTHAEVVKGWRTCHESLEYVNAGGSIAIDPWGICVAEQGQIRTPKGAIRYAALRKETDEKGKQEWVYGEGRNKSRIYAGKITENLVQHLSRFILADAKLEYEKVTGFPVVLDVYDEIVSVVPEKHADQALATLQDIMRRSPSWMPELALWSEGDIADSYGEAK